MLKASPTILSSLGRFDDDSARTDFCNKIWPGVEQYDQQTPLIRRYQRCCNAVFVYGGAVAEQQNSNIVRTVEAVRSHQDHDQLLKLVTEIVHEGHRSKDCVPKDQKVAEHLITIASTITLMCNIEVGQVQSSSMNPSVRQLVWQDGNVKSLISNAFPKSNNLEGVGRLSRTFHARNLERLGSIQIVWTHNLLDHLRLHDPVKNGLPFTVTVFHYAQFLHSVEQSDLFPDGFISETLRTLALLFPGHVGGTTGWFKEQQKSNKDLDMSACFCSFSDNENRTIQSFTYWRDRITILKQTYDEAEPRTILQWWKDGRKPERWATFWVAVLVLFLTIFFGLVQCIEGAMQVYKAYHPS